MAVDTETFNPDKPVLVIGSSGLDIVGRIDTELQTGTSIPSVIRSSYGGVARNVAENLARLGQPVILLSAIGQDHAGDQLLSEAKNFGINIDYVIRSPYHSTGTYIALLGQSNELLFGIHDMRVIDLITPEEMIKLRDLFKQVSLIFIDANLPQETMRTVFVMAKRARLKVCVDPTSSHLAIKLKPYLKNCFLITPNIIEAAILCEAKKPLHTRRQAINAAKDLVTQGVEIAVITIQEQELCYATSETSGYVPALRTEIIDPVGAGDALTAALIFALLNDIPLDDAVRLGVSAASLTLRHPGAVAPDLSLEKLYDQLVV